MQSLIVLHLNIMCLGFFLANPKLKIVTINKKNGLTDMASPF